MAESLKQLRRRIRSVSNVRQITRAMEMVSASKLRRAQGVLHAGRPYAAKLQELLRRLAGSAAVEGNPLFERRERVARRTLVLFTPDRGLCGSFANNLIQQAERYSRESGETPLEMFCVGNKGHDHFRKRHWEIAGAMRDLQGRVDAEKSRDLAARLQQRFLSGQTDEVWLLFSRFVSAAHFHPVAEQFLPIQAEDLPEDEVGARRRPIDYIFEPSAGELFGALLPQYLQSRIYITIAEQFTSEHSARMLAMHNATENCSELQDQLTLQMNKARQASITRELLDIVGGAEALKEV